MRASSITLEGSARIINAQIEVGTSLPTSPLEGRIFFLTTTWNGHDKGLYIFDGSSWQTGDISSVSPGAGLSGGGSAGDVTLSLDSSISSAISAATAHASDTALHLTSAQNILLDAINASSTEINYLTGATANIQTQINAISIPDAGASGNILTSTGSAWVSTPPANVDGGGY